MADGRAEHGAQPTSARTAEPVRSTVGGADRPGRSAVGDSGPPHERSCTPLAGCAGVALSVLLPKRACVLRARPLG